MSRIGRPSGLCLAALILPLAIRAADPAADPQTAVVSALAIQDAMRQGKERLQHGQAKAAVDALEAQLPRINGNPAYLGLLREAYSTYVKELELAHDDDKCDVYQKRLQILDKSAVAAAPARVPTPAQPVAQTAKPEDDPLQQTPRRVTQTDSSVLPEAEKAFAEKRYAEADQLFLRALGPEATDPQHTPQWAYCKLFMVVARLKDAEAAHTPVPASDLDQEVTAALRLAADDAKLVAFGRQVMDAVRQRTTGAAPPVTVRHQDRGSDGWTRAESANFRLMHNQPRDFAEQVVRAAESARAAAIEKWAGSKAADWKPACEIYLYSSRADYAKATGKPADSPGHATYKAQNGAVVGRRLDLRADDPSLIGCVVPHETTHLVLGDLFADAPLPRWADEGMAVLAEPRARFDQFTRTLYSNRHVGRLVPLEQLFGKADYPDAALITVFYVESVSVVDFLVAEKGPQEFVQFLHDVAKSGLDAALQKHYDCRSVTMLEERWRIKMFSGAEARANGSPGVQ
jgi:hypothetical protein